MIPFIVIALALVGAALALVLPPLLRRPQAPPGSEAVQAGTALAVLREQLGELEREHAAGAVDALEYQRQRDELEVRALAEGQAQDRSAELKPARGWAVLAAVVVPLLALGLYLFLGNPDALDPIQREGAPAMTRAQVEQMVSSLAEKVAKEPDNLEGWAMLARAYRTMERYDDASRAYEHLAGKLPQNAQVLADWADVIGAAQGHRLDGKPAELVARALQLDPNNGKALALGGTIAFEQKRYAEAAQDWEKLLSQLSPDDEIASAVRRGVDEARARAGMPALGAAPGATPTATLSLRGELRLDQALASQAKPDDTVFVFVRADGGGPPLAAQRFKVSQLPVSFDFTDAQMMVPGRPVPPQVSLGARVSHSGDPMPAPGDLEGSLGPVAAGANGLVLTIDQVRK